MSEPLSIPRRGAAPRPLGEDEYATLARLADTLIPARGEIAPASAEPGFAEQLGIALDARSDAFDAIVAALHTFAAVPQDDGFAWLERLADSDPETFQALSAVAAGAWLLTAGVRARIGYRGLVVDRAGLEDAADDLTSGLLDPVLERAGAEPNHWIH